MTGTSPTTTTTTTTTKTTTTTTTTTAAAAAAAAAVIVWVTPPRQTQTCLNQSYGNLRQKCFIETVFVSTSASLQLKESLLFRRELAPL
jgi:prephenate dehydrogenase